LLETVLNVQPRVATSSSGKSNKKEGDEKEAPKSSED
jgi:hypothetical protein